MVMPQDSDRATTTAHNGEEFPFSLQLTDFGLVNFSDLKEADTRSSQMIGNPLHKPPECLSDCEATAAADAAVFSLGVILFEMLTGRLPIDCQNYMKLITKICRQAPQRLRSLRPTLPKTLDQICAKCWQKEPEARCETAADLADDLRRCVDNLPTCG